MMTREAETATMEYRTLADIAHRKQVLKRTLNNDNEQIRLLWNQLFHQEKAATPSNRVTGIMNTSANVVDGLILGWKLYRRFKPSKKSKKSKGFWTSIFSRR